MMNKDLFLEKEVEIYIKRKKLLVPTNFVMNYWRKKKWETLRGEQVKTIDAVVNVCNSIFVTRLKRENNIKQAKKKIDEANGFCTYKEQLKSEEWKAFRAFIFAAKGKVCESCGRASNLQVHHKTYISGRKAWEYLPQDLMVLCEKCHKKIHNIL